MTDLSTLDAARRLLTGALSKEELAALHAVPFDSVRCDQVDEVTCGCALRAIEELVRVPIETEVIEEHEVDDQGQSYSYYDIYIKRAGDVPGRIYLDYDSGEVLERIEEQEDAEALVEILGLDRCSFHMEESRLDVAATDEGLSALVTIYDAIYTLAKRDSKEARTIEPTALKQAKKAAQSSP